MVNANYVHMHITLSLRFVYAEKTKALLFQGANPTMDTGKVLGLAVQNGRHHEATNGPSCAVDHGQLAFSSSGVLSAFPRTNGVTCSTVAAANGSSGSDGGGGHTGLLGYFTSSHNPARAAEGRVQCPGRSGGRQVCCGCRRQCVLVGVQLCDHCEKAVCGDCCRQCCVCQSVFCNFCTVLK